MFLIKPHQLDAFQELPPRELTIPEAVQKTFP